MTARKPIAVPAQLQDETPSKYKRRTGWDLNTGRPVPKPLKVDTVGPLRTAKERKIRKIAELAYGFGKPSQQVAALLSEKGVKARNNTGAIVGGPDRESLIHCGETAVVVRSNLTAPASKGAPGPFGKTFGISAQLAARLVEALDALQDLVSLDERARYQGDTLHPYAKSSPWAKAWARARRVLKGGK